MYNEIPGDATGRGWRVWEGGAATARRARCLLDTYLPTTGFENRARPEGRTRTRVAARRWKRDQGLRQEFTPEALGRGGTPPHLGLLAVGGAAV